MAEVVATNYFKDPYWTRLTGAVFGAGGAGTFTTETDPDGETFARMTWTTATTDASTKNTGVNMHSGGPDAADLVAGETWSSQIQLRTNRAGAFRLYLQFLDSAGANIGNNLVDMTLAADTWTDAVIEGAVVPAGAASIRLLPYAWDATRGWLVGDTYDMRRVGLTRAATADPFFYGDTPDTRDYTYAWTGVAGDSTSTKSFDPIISVRTGGGTADLPALVVSISGNRLTVGEPVTVMGHAPDGTSWLVRGGDWTAEGTPRLLVDARAPLAEEVTYRLSTPAESWEADPITRTWAGRDVITSLDGRVVAEFRWMAAGGAPMEQEPRHATYAVPGRPRPLMHLDPVAGAGGGSLTARMERPGIDAMRALVRSNSPLLLLHNQARCSLPGCDLPTAETVFFPRVPTDRVSVARAERDWALSYLLVDDPEPDTIVPLSTWADFDAAGLTWAQFDALGLTWAEFDETEWSTYAQ